MTAPTFPNIPAPIDVFISYSHEDDYWRKELEKHLSNLKRQREIADWSDRKKVINPRPSNTDQDSNNLALLPPLPPWELPCIHKSIPTKVPAFKDRFKAS
jgi:hypothetical protein